MVFLVSIFSFFKNKETARLKLTSALNVELYDLSGEVSGVWESCSGFKGQSHDDRTLVCVPPSKWEAEVYCFRVGFVEQRH